MKKKILYILLLALVVIPCGLILSACGEKKFYILKIDENCTYVTFEQGGVSKADVGMYEGETETFDVMLDNAYDASTLKVFLDDKELIIDNKNTTQSESFEGRTKVGTITFSNLTNNGVIEFECEERLINFSFNVLNQNKEAVLENSDIKPILENLYFKNVDYSVSLDSDPSLYTILKDNISVKISYKNYSDKKFIMYSNLYKAGGLSFSKMVEVEPYVNDYKYFIEDYSIEGIVDIERKNYSIFSYSEQAKINMNIDVNIDCVIENENIGVNSFESSFVSHRNFNNENFEGNVIAYSGNGGKLVVNKIEGFDYSNAGLYIFDTKVLDLANSSEYIIQTNKMPIEFISDDYLSAFTYLPTDYDIYIKGLVVNDSTKLDSLTLVAGNDNISFQAPNKYVELDNKYYNATGESIRFNVNNNVTAIDVEVDGVKTTYTSADWSTTQTEPDEQTEVYMYSDNLNETINIILDFDATGHEIIVTAR